MQGLFDRFFVGVLFTGFPELSMPSHVVLPSVLVRKVSSELARLLGCILYESPMLGFILKGFLDLYCVLFI